VNAKILVCLVSIKYADIIEERTVPCWEYEDGKRFLIIPLEEYPLVHLHHDGEMMLALDPHACVVSSAPEYALFCHAPIDLDNYGLLKWTPQKM
jgi:hypothetical protein